MIEFSGQILDSVQIDRAKRLIKYETMLCSVSGIGIVILGIVLGLLLGFLKDIWIELVIFSVGWPIIIILINFTPKSSLLRFRICPHIIINETELSYERLYNTGEMGTTTKPINKVKKVLDCGEVYYIIFRFGDISNAWICQKSNIINGTIEEFEALFQQKLVRTIK